MCPHVHVLCNVNTTGISCLWDFKKLMASVRLKQILVLWWWDEVMHSTLLHSGSHDKVVTSIEFLEVESGWTWSPCLPQWAMWHRLLSCWLFRADCSCLAGTDCPGSSHSLPCFSLSMWWHNFSAGPNFRPMYFIIMSLRSSIRAFPSISCGGKTWWESQMIYSRQSL